MAVYVVQHLDNHYQVMTVDAVPPAQLTYMTFHDLPWPTVKLFNTVTQVETPLTISGLIEDFGHQRRLTAA